MTEPHDTTEIPGAPPAGPTMTDAPPGPPPAPRPPRPTLRRSTSDKVLAGVAGGLARTLDIDAVVVRIVLVALAVTYPAVVVAYLAAVLLVPGDGEPGRVRGGVALRDGGIALWLMVAVLVAVVLGVGGGSLSAFGGSRLFPLALVGVGVALWTRGGSPSATAPHGSGAAWPAAPGQPVADGTVASAQSGPSTLTPWPGQSSPDAPLAPAAHGLVSPGASAVPGGPGGPTVQSWDTPGAPVTPPARLPRPPHSRLGPVTLALALITAGVVAGLGVADVLYVRPTEVAAVALLVLGLGLLVGSVFGRAKWLILVALLLLPPVIGGAVFREVPLITDIDVSTDVGVADGVGERIVNIAASDPVPDDIKLLAGSIQLDLTQWQPTATQRSELDGTQQDMLIEVGAGEVVLRMPQDVAWQVWARVGLGEVQLLYGDGTSSSMSSPDQLGTSIEPVMSGGPQGGPVLDVVVEMNLGQLTVYEPATTDSTEELS